MKKTNKRRSRKNRIIVSVFMTIAALAFAGLVTLEESIKYFGMSLITGSICGGVLVLVLLICGVFFHVNSDILDKMASRY